MNFLTIGIETLLLIVFTINFISVLLIRSTERFWLPSIVLWFALFSVFVVVNITNTNAMESPPRIFDENNYSTVDKWMQEQETANREEQKTTDIIFKLLSFQTVLSFLWLILGYQQTGIKYYKSAATTFFLMILFYILFKFLIP